MDGRQVELFRTYGRPSSQAGLASGGADTYPHAQAPTAAARTADSLSDAKLPPSEPGDTHASFMVNHR
jgi:hypothetical protein